MNTTTATIEVWSRFPFEENRLDPTSRLAREVLHTSQPDPRADWHLDNVYVTKPTPIRKPNAFERAHALAKHGRHI